MTVFTQKLRAVMGLDPDRAELEFEQRDYSWGEIARTVALIEAQLAAADLPADARIGVLLRNRPGHVCAVLAVLATERCLVTLNPLLPDERLAEDLAALDLPVVIADEDDCARPPLTRATGGRIEIGTHLEHVRTARERPAGSAPVPVSPGVAIEMLTSGTTGRPKRVPLSRAAFDASFAGFAGYERGKSFAPAARLSSGVVMVANPLTHIGGLYGCIGALLAGRRIVLLEKFSVAAWVDAVRRNRPKVAPAVPSAVRMLLEAEVDRADLASLSAIICGTAPLPAELVDAFLERYGVPILSNYGATEFAGAVAGWTIDDFRAHWAEKRGAAGRVHGNVRARIVSPETGEPRPCGQEGLLEIQGEQLGGGYAIGGERWLRTTDRAILDDDGFLTIRGRADNAIIRGGFKIHPDDVVAAILGHPAVREAAVVGVPDARLGAVPAAAVILKRGSDALSEEDLRGWLRERLMPYQVPVHVRVVDDFPRTPSMKPSTPALTALFTADTPKGE